MSTIKTILFVENDPVALQMYNNRLEREGFHLETAQDGLEALKILSQLTPDLVVLDMILPKLGGGDVLKFMRADTRLKSLPVIIFSNAPLTELPQGLEQAGPTRHLLKSDCTFPMLLQSIGDFLAAASTDGSSVAPVDDCSSAQPQAGTSQVEATSPSSAPVTAGCAEFLREALAEVPRIREHCFAYIKAPASPASLQHLPNLYQHVHFLSANAAKSGCARVAMLTAAFDTLLSEIMVKPSWVTPSVLQTIAQAVDCLGFLLKSNEVDLSQPMPQARVLAVDDDAVCNHVMVTTLKRAKFDAKSVDDPLVALQLLQTNHYDLVLLDINMPDLTGFELCEKLRRFPHCKTTPVIFITGHNNFDNRKQSVLSGGHDFITKPISPSELALKATIHLLKARVQRAPAPHANAESAPVDASTALPGIQADTQQAPADDPPSPAPALSAIPSTGNGAPVAPATNVPPPAAEPIPVTMTMTATPPAAADQNIAFASAAPAVEPSSPAPDTAAPAGSGTPDPVFPETVSPPSEPASTGISQPAPSLDTPGPLNPPEIQKPDNTVAPDIDVQTPAASGIDQVQNPTPIGVSAPFVEPPPQSAVQHEPQPAITIQFSRQDDGEPDNIISPVNASPVTVESNTNDAQMALSPVVASPPVEPAATNVPDAELQSAAAIPSNALETAQTESGTPASSETPGPANPGNLSGENLPGADAGHASSDSSAAPVSTVPDPVPTVVETGLDVVASVTETGTSNGSDGLLPLASGSLNGAGADGSSGDEYPTSHGSSEEETNWKFDKIVTIVARIMFGDDNLTERNLRLVHAALERYEVHEILKNPAPMDGKHPHESVHSFTESTAQVDASWEDTR